MKGALMWACVSKQGLSFRFPQFSRSAQAKPSGEAETIRSEAAARASHVTPPSGW